MRDSDSESLTVRKCAALYILAVAPGLSTILVLL